MKRKLPVLIAIVLALLISLSACSGLTQPIAKGGQADPQMANIQDSDPVFQEDPVDAAPADTDNQTADETDPKYITMDEAIAIALKDAGFTQEQVKGLHAELERDDGVTIYDVDFYKDSKEYDYEIHAETGEILKPVEKATSDRTSSSGSSSSGNKTETTKKLTKDEAISKALSHAGLKKSQVFDLDAELDKENGKLIYEVDFETAEWEYEYEINASTGKIIKAEKDRND